MGVTNSKIVAPKAFSANQNYSSRHRLEPSPMTDIIPLLVGAVIVGVIHMSAPDHWVTLCILSTKAGWNKRKLFNVSIITATGHAFLSAILGLAIAVVGVYVSTLISLFLSLIIGAVMLVVGLFIGLKALFSHKKIEVTPEEKLLEKIEKSSMGIKGLSYFAILGAALSPDLSITPFFLGAVPSGLMLAIYVFIVFVVVSVLSEVVLVQVGTCGLAKSFEKVPEKYNDAIVGFVIAAVGIYIMIVG